MFTSLKIINFNILWKARFPPFHDLWYNATVKLGAEIRCALFYHNTCFGSFLRARKIADNKKPARKGGIVKMCARGSEIPSTPLPSSIPTGGFNEVSRKSPLAELIDPVPRSGFKTSIQIVTVYYTPDYYTDSNIRNLGWCLEVLAPPNSKLTPPSANILIHWILDEKQHNAVFL